MNTLPNLLARALVVLGISDGPQRVQAIEVSKPDEPRKGVFSQNRNPNKYDADAEFIALDAPRTDVFDFKSKRDPWGREIAIMEGSIYLTNGSKYRLQRFSSQAELNTLLEGADAGFARIRDKVQPPWQLREASASELTIETEAYYMLNVAMHLLEAGLTIEEARAKLREDFDSGGSFEGSYNQDWNMPPSPRGIYGSGFDPMAEYTPLQGGPWNKQLYLSQYLEMHAKAFEAYNHNPIAKQLIDLTTAFVFGRGVDYTCTDIEVDEVLREFADRTNYFYRLEQNATDFWWSGNMFKEWYTDTPKKGQSDYRCNDPSTILEVVTDPEDIRKVYYYHQQYATQFQNLYTLGADKSAKGVLTMKYIIRHIPSGDVDHYKLNCSEWEKYGRSDLFPVLGWLKRLKDLLNARVVKGLLEAAFVWDITIATDNADVNETAVQVPDPYNPGSTFVHNKTLELKAQTGSLTHGGDNMPDAQMLIQTIATGVGTPKEFLGETSRMSKSGSLTATEPGTKRYERRQRLMEMIILNDFDRVIQTAEDAGELDIESILVNARSVRRLADTDEQSTRSDIAADMQDLVDQNDATNQANVKTASAATDPANPTAIPPAPKSPTLPVSTATKAKEAFADVSGKKDATAKLNPAQKRRVQAIMRSRKYARELIEVSFPSIAAEDRSAKLKDLALAEAMEWLPKSITATMAAKELGITMYEFQSIWRTIVAEAAAGMSVAHVFGQDNKHVPVVAQAQSVQEEMTAMQPPAAQPITTVPQPPAVAGLKQVPNKGATGGNGVTPGAKPNSGDTKVNNKLATPPINPTDPSPKRSAAAQSPFTNEGKANIAKEADTVRTALYAHILREAIHPLPSDATTLAQYVLGNDAAVREFEEAVERLVNA